MLSNLEPKYRITLTVERSDQPGAKLKAIFRDVPRATAENPSYPHYSAIECFRLCAMSETRPDPREG
jgi:hypothetical protein